MFRKIMVSVPMEQFPELAIERAGYLSELLGSSIVISYFIEDEVFDKVSDLTTHVITEKDQDSWERKMTRSHERIARNVIMDEAKRITGTDDLELIVEKGTYSNSLLKAVEESGCDLILMEYHSFDLLKYSIMDRSPVPVWIVRNRGPVKKIGLFCTNLARNTMAPRIAKNMKKAFGSRLEAYYIRDPEGDADETEPEDISRKFRFKWKDVVDDKVESFITDTARERDLDLMILGRIKKKGYFHMRSKFAKRARASVLLVH